MLRGGSRDASRDGGLGGGVTKDGSVNVKGWMSVCVCVYVCVCVCVY